MKTATAGHNNQGKGDAVGFTAGKSMKKNTKILIILFAAVIFAVGAGYGVLTAINSQKTKIYIFNADYKAGTQVNTSMFTPMEVDKNIVIEGKKGSLSTAFVTSSEYDQIIKTGDSLRTDVSKGIYLTSALLTQKGGNEIENTMTSTAIAVTVSVNSITGVTNELSAGSYVNLTAITGASTTTYQKMRILDVQKASDGTITAVTVECDFETQQAIEEASNSGYIHLGLVNSNGYQVIDTSSSTEESSTTATK